MVFVFVWTSDRCVERLQLSLSILGVEVRAIGKAEQACNCQEGGLGPLPVTRCLQGTWLMLLETAMTRSQGALHIWACPSSSGSYPSYASSAYHEIQNDGQSS